MKFRNRCRGVKEEKHRKNLFSGLSRIPEFLLNLNLSVYGPIQFKIVFVYCLTLVRFEGIRTDILIL